MYKLLINELAHQLEECAFAASNNTSNGNGHSIGEVSCLLSDTFYMLYYSMHTHGSKGQSPSAKTVLTDRLQTLRLVF